MTARRPSTLDARRRLFHPSVASFVRTPTQPRTQPARPPQLALCVGPIALLTSVRSQVHEVHAASDLGGGCPQGHLPAPGATIQIP
jgi:hypothetical protein